MNDDAPLPTSPETLMATLENVGITYVLHKHKAVFTCEESAFLYEKISGLHVKNLFLRDKKGQMALITLPDASFPDLKKLAPALGMGRISFGSAERLWENLGVRPGSVCPFAVMNDKAGAVRMVLDKSVADAPQMNAHPLLNSMTLSLSGADLVRFLTDHGHKPEIIDLTPYDKSLNETH